MVTNHDLLMKELIAAYPVQFLALAAPDLAALVDGASVGFEPEEHYGGSPTGHARRCDLVSRAALIAPEDVRSVDLPASGTGRPASEIVLHVEIELRYRASIQPRLLRYHRGLSLKYGVAVHTLVLFLRGGSPDSRSRVYVERSVGRIVGALGYTSFGLSRARAAEYLLRPEPLAWAFAALMQPAPSQTRSQLGLACVARIAGDESLGPHDRRLLIGCVLTYANLDESDAREFDKIMEGLDDEGVQIVKMSMTEFWRREGLEKGRSEGLAEGRSEGRSEGAQDLVMQLLVRRFGELSDKTLRRLRAIVSPEELANLAERVYQVDSLEELGLA